MFHTHACAFAAFAKKVAKPRRYMLASDLLPKMHIDDPVEAFAVHGACALSQCYRIRARW